MEHVAFGVKILRPAAAYTIPKRGLASLCHTDNYDSFGLSGVDAYVVKRRLHAGKYTVRFHTLFERYSHI